MDHLSIFQVTASLAFVLAGIWGVGKAITYWRQRQGTNGSVKGRRLQLVETLFIDTQNRIILVKCDEEEHLILLGAKGETLLKGLLGNNQVLHPFKNKA